MNLPHNFMRDYYKHQKKVFLSPGDYTSEEIRNATTLTLASETTVIVEHPTHVTVIDTMAFGKNGSVISSDRGLEFKGLL